MALAIGLSWTARQESCPEGRTKRSSQRSLAARPTRPRRSTFRAAYASRSSSCCTNTTPEGSSRRSAMPSSSRSSSTEPSWRLRASIISRSAVWATACPQPDVEVVEHLPHDVAELLRLELLALDPGGQDPVGELVAQLGVGRAEPGQQLRCQLGDPLPLRKSVLVVGDDAPEGPVHPARPPRRPARPVR